MQQVQDASPLLGSKQAAHLIKKVEVEPHKAHTEQALRQASDTCSGS